MVQARSTISQATAMRALAVGIFLAVHSYCTHANQTNHYRISTPDAVISVFKLTEYSPVGRLVDCGQSLGLTKCVYALSAWRAKHASESFEKEREAKFNLAADIEHFPWEQYSNSTNEQIYSELCDGTERLLQYRSLKFNLIPGYLFELESKGNGTLAFDVFRKNDMTSARNSMKKFQKQFYNIVPYLLVPGLIMSAILPFVLPALKLMTVAVGMLNNMALSGAIFTLLRNNAFNDYYEKKVVYYNAGYKNEKHATIHHEQELYHTAGENFDTPSQLNGGSDFIEQKDQPGDDINAAGENLSNSDWINQYYGGNEYLNSIGYKNRRNSQTERNQRIKKTVHRK